MASPDVRHFFHLDTETASYLVVDPAAKRAVVIDPVLDYDPAAGRTGTASAQAILDAIKAGGLTLELILDTHIHADHISAAAWLREQTGAPTAIGANEPQVRALLAPLFADDPDDPVLVNAYDRFLADGETFQVGEITAKAIWTPGHTPACMSYLVGDALFVGDTLFMPDVGVARCDFPGGDAKTLYRSIQRLYELPGETRVFVCHDYKSPDRDQYAVESTIAAQAAGNIHLPADRGLEDFVKFRVERDAGLNVPRLILPSVQANLRAGAIPTDAQGRKFIKIPVDAI